MRHWKAEELLNAWATYQTPSEKPIGPKGHEKTSPGRPNPNRRAYDRVCRTQGYGFARKALVDVYLNGLPMAGNRANVIGLFTLVLNEDLRKVSFDPEEDDRGPNEAPDALYGLVTIQQAAALAQRTVQTIEKSMEPHIKKVYGRRYLSVIDVLGMKPKKKEKKAS